jgi:hypothetical protein
MPFLIAASFIPLLFWIATLSHVARTQEQALSRRSQMAWVGLLIFFPFPSLLFYWLMEAPRRRNRPPRGFA